MKRSILTAALAAVFALATAHAQFVPGGQGRGYGQQNGTGTHVPPRDGTGYGAKRGNQNPSGTCDKTGPKGNQGSRQAGPRGQNRQAGGAGRGGRR